MKRALIVDSTDDGITRERHEILSTSELVKDYSIGYVYVFDITDEERAMPFQAILSTRALTDKHLYEQVKAGIDRHSPDYVLLHTGFIFRRYPTCFYKVFRRLQSEYPNIGFGFQRRREMEIDESVFTDREDVRSVANLFFNEVLQL